MSKQNLSIKDPSLLQYLKREDNLSIKDKIVGPKHVHYSEVLLYYASTTCIAHPKCSRQTVCFAGSLALAGTGTLHIHNE